MKKTKRQLVTCGVMTMAIVFVMMFVLTSCVTRKTLTEQVAVRDTLRESHCDTVRLATHHSRTDTLRESKVQVITLRLDSARTDTMRVETILEKWHTVYVTDTVNTFRHLADSLQSVIEKQSVKKESVMHPHKFRIWCIVTLLVLTVAITLLVIGQRKQ